MNYLLENAVPIWAAGAVLLTMAFVAYFQTRSRGPLIAMLVIALVTGALLVVEHAIETSRESVERTLDEIAAMIEADNVPGVLNYIAPAATDVRSDAQTLMPLVTVEKARILGTPDIALDNEIDPRAATVNCQAMVNVVVKQNRMKGPYMDRVTIHFVREGDRWMIKSYTPQNDWRRELR